MVGRPARRPDRTTAVNSGRRRRRACAGNTSGGEFLATLAPTTGEDRPARAGAHPQPEAVGLRPSAVVRLGRGLGIRGGRRWVFACRRLWGWNVRLLTRSSHYTTAAVRPRRWADTRGAPDGKMPYSGDPGSCYCGTEHPAPHLHSRTARMEKAA